MKKIKIAGAGIAGLTTAINLAKKGYKVEVYEKNSDVGLRHHGDFQGIENWSSKEDVRALLKKINIKINFLCKPYFSGALYGPIFNKKSIKSKKPLFYLVQRGNQKNCLDYCLKKQALDLGVNILFKKRIDNQTATIVATGPKIPHIIAVGYTFKTDLDDMAVGIFDDTLAPKGYAYLLVNKRKATLATVLFKDFKNQKNYLDKTISKFKKILNLKMKKKKKFAGYGNWYTKNTTMKKDKLYVGEAAGFQDALWGFGMKYAFISGYLAAKSITENKNYNYLWKKELLGKLKTSLSNRFLYELMDNKRYNFIISKMTVKKDITAFLRKNYNPSITKKIVYPLAKNFLMNRSK